MMEPTRTFGQAALTVIEGAAASQEQSTKASQASELEKKRHFLTVIQRWERLFKRADSGNIDGDKWLIAEYYKSLGHLSPADLDTLTEELKTRCTFFPSIKECLEIIRPKRFDYASPFYRQAHLSDSERLIGSPHWYRAARLDHEKAKLLADGHNE